MDVKDADCDKARLAVCRRPKAKICRRVGQKEAVYCVKEVLAIDAKSVEGYVL